MSRLPNTASSTRLERMIPGSAVFLLAMRLMPVVASGDGCTYDPATFMVSVSVSGVSGDRPDNVLSVGPGGSIYFEGVACGLATVANTDTVVVAGSSITDFGFFIDLQGGPFAPGVSPEADGRPEIEVRVDLGDHGDWIGIWGTDGADSLVAGQFAVDLNRDRDGDVLLTNIEQISLSGLGSQDFLSAAGGDALGGPTRLSTSIHGGKGSDTILGGLNNVFVAGESGNDVIAGGSRGDSLYAGPDDDIVKGYGGGDGVFGGAGNDIVKGHSGSDALIGRAGDDRLLGGSGSDFCRQGPGTGPIRSCEKT